ncbi:hypothetical protein RB620_14425 [Paenibacillus sp. LHD-117]|uniref:hypothetical protein n=1 Tax=Paenibacillus sp. LHD-117 TaxID=3071412 RepID=UPI0027DF5AD9|nr:hypothetical protein [Paenibacillus sp. LHD-117]MDQ6420623.1 hypothetical protein [Paenibacillus sp. LHD-117]
MEQNLSSGMERTKLLMTDFKERGRQVRKLIADQACTMPLLPSGLWFHGDIRDNFYYASYLYAAAIEDEQLAVGKVAAINKATSVLLGVLSLQDRDPGSDTYGHWPLNLGERPAQAPINRLPVELMGCLIAVFNQRYGDSLPSALRSSLSQSIEHMYLSRYYAAPLRMYNHHEAKHTAAAILFGTIKQDRGLVQSGGERVRSTLAQLQAHGMTEYGILPWFWHWTQAYSAAWEIVQDDGIRADIETLLEWLWKERADHYFQGAWAGPHSRSLPMDAPADRCVAFDYVQFGDFPLPLGVQRAEYAGLLAYEISESLRRQVLERQYPFEITRDYPSSVLEQDQTRHSYVYMDEHFALGGMLERASEFDNEQHRWDFTFPIRDGSVNQAYFVHPAANAKDKLRHSSDAEEIALNRNCLVALYQPISEADKKQGIVGILPLGEWVTGELALYGQVGQTYLAVHFMKPFIMEAIETGLEVEALEGGSNGVVLEAISTIEAAAYGISSLDDFVTDRGRNKPRFTYIPLSASYVSITGMPLSLRHSR